MTSKRKFLAKAWLALAMIPVLFFIYAPLAWLLTSSISTRADLLAIPPRFFPAHPTRFPFPPRLFAW
ncbi:MAG: hypothetical protein NT121_10665 [Chloroflexi bacterium]|nr:hypothetical protein [Chloroflexota bacterium]